MLNDPGGAKGLIEAYHDAKGVPSVQGWINVRELWKAVRTGALSGGVITVGMTVFVSLGASGKLIFPRASEVSVGLFGAFCMMVADAFRRARDGEKFALVVPKSPGESSFQGVAYADRPIVAQLGEPAPLRPGVGKNKERESLIPPFPDTGAPGFVHVQTDGPGESGKSIHDDEDGAEPIPSVEIDDPDEARETVQNQGSVYTPNLPKNAHYDLTGDRGRSDEIPLGSCYLDARRDCENRAECNRLGCQQPGRAIE